MTDLDQVQNTLLDLKGDLGQVTGTLAVMQEAVKTHDKKLDKVNEKVSAIETKVSTLSARQRWIAGVIGAVGGGVVAATWKWLADKISFT